MHYINRHVDIDIASESVYVKLYSQSDSHRIIYRHAAILCRYAVSFFPSKFRESSDTAEDRCGYGASGRSCATKAENGTH